MSITDFPVLRTFRPMLERLRDSIGSTQVINVPSGRYIPGSVTTVGINPMKSFHPTSPVRNRRGMSFRQRRESAMSVSSTATALTAYSFVMDTAKGASATISKTYRDGNFDCVAVKRIKGEIFKGHEEELMQMLDREKLALEELGGCPYVTKFYEYVRYEPTNEHWMVMEFCDGGSAIELLKTEISLNQIAAIVGATLRAIEFVHSKGYIHGDIKCANILLASPGVVKLCDFGLASKIKDVDEPDYHALGTVEYMAPEVMARSLAIDDEDPFHERLEYDRKIDIWAIGIVVLELLIGRPPLHEFRRFSEDNFSRFIADIPQREALRSGMVDLLIHPRAIDEYVEKKYIDADKVVPDRDIVKLCKRFPDLQKVQDMSQEGENKLMELLAIMSSFDRRPQVKISKQLFQRNPASLVGSSMMNKMYSTNKCLSFVSHCLILEPEWRPEADEIGMHPFVKGQYKEYLKLEPDIEAIMLTNKSRAARKHLWKNYQTSVTIREVNKIIAEKQRKVRRGIRAVLPKDV